MAAYLKRDIGHYFGHNMTVEYFNEGKRIPSLDGMRAVAIGVVILAHALGTVPFLTRSQVYHITGNLGPLGCDFFLSSQVF